MNSPDRTSTNPAEFTLTVKPLPDETILGMVERLAARLKEMDASIVNLIAFGALVAHPVVIAAMRRVFGKMDWPIMWVEGQTREGDSVAGIQVFAFAGPVRRIQQQGRVIGSVYEHGGARHCWLGGMGPHDISQPRAEQAAETFAGIQSALAQEGFTLNDVVRTWFYNDDILSWYSDFNRVRNSVYSATRFRTGSMPVSTGIAGRNPGGAALTAGLWAVQPLSPALRIEEVASPLQCPAPAYGSSFSRAMEMDSIEGRYLLVSGTASIAPGGQTVWQGDPQKQVDLTMQVVEAILRSRGFGFEDVTRATAYFKHEADVGIFADWCAKNHIAMPAVLFHSDICRDDLLFELEADAWKPKTAANIQPQ